MFYKKLRNAYRGMVYTRADDTGAVFYFSAEDFEGLKQEPFSFASSDGHFLQGYFYSYPNAKEDRLIVFEHGMGSGHRGYMREIELLARQGYLVFAYDHTGCMESGGETTGGFVQSLKDLDDALVALKSEKELHDRQISVVGHSWGGFSTLNIAALHPDLHSVVAISGFVSVELMLNQFFGGIMRGVGKRLLQEETEANPNWISCNAIDALSDSPVKALIIHSEDDPTVSCKAHFDLMQSTLADKDNITFLKVNGKRHNPNYTVDAVQYKDRFFATYQKALKKKALSTDAEKQAFIDGFDWKRMTEQDMEIWNTIFEFLN
ncbi:MAG: alpha/beta fold hydrolase [Clostridia bacterium]|nr:alpha/beta fold hydrolase [Clostridia bacterium]